MHLDAGLISQFVKATNDDKPVKREEIVYGTVVVYDGKKYVKMDGSELLTPISATTKVEDDERVIVTIKDHSAIVTGNLTSPSASNHDVEIIGTKISEFEIIVADKVDTKELTAVSGRIDDLETEFLTVTDSFTAVNGKIKNLETDNVDIKNSLTAAEANITKLTTNDATITGRLDAADAKINSLQTDNATINNTLTAQNANITNLQSSHAEFEEATVERFEAAEADITKLNTDKLNATDADIKYATIENLDVATGKITSLESTFGDFEALTTNKLAANEANIEELETKYAEIENLDTKYANIDFANIGEAAVEKIFAGSGLIKDIVVGDGTITGNLVGVTIKGDLIEGGTVVADKLVVKGTDGLYYKLNTDGVTTETEQTDYNSLNGSIITAKSITATKISVTDLVAFGATIGGFKITDNAIHSVVKDSVNNTTRGIYLDNSGQIAIGDASNCIKYYKDTDGTYKLYISADSMKLSSGTSMSSLASDVATVKDTANIAKSTAEAANSNAANALGTAGQANTTAESAKSIADSAYTKATNAKDTADQAITRISTAETNIEKNAQQIALTATKKEVSESLEGYYTKQQADAAIKVSADNITSSVFSTYATKDELASTVTQTNTAIEQASNNILLTASKTYATQTDLEATDDKIDSLDVGGRNYLLKSNRFESKGSGSSGITTSLDDGVLVVDVHGTSAWVELTHINNNNVITDNFKTGDEFVFSMEIKRSGSSTEHPTCQVALNERFLNMIGTISGEYTTVYYTGIWNASKSPYFRLFWSNCVDTFYIRKPKFERGNKPTDWTPAQEDVDEGIDNAANSAGAAKAAADNNARMISQALIEINGIKNTISTLVTGQNGESLMVQTENGWQFNMTSVLNALDSTANDIDGLNNSLSDTDNKVNTLDNAVDDFGKYTDAIQIVIDEGHPCIILGEKDSDFKVKINNTAIKLMQGTKSPAVITNDQIEIETAYVKGQIQQGNFAWAARSNGNYGLVWR